MTPKQDRLTGISLAVLATILWSGNFIVARGLYKAISPVSLSFFRWSTATIVLLPIAFTTFKKEWPLIRPHLKILAVTAFFGITLFNTLVYVAGHYTSATNLAIIGTTASPVFVVLISAVFFQDKIGFFKITGMLVCIAGLLFLISEGEIDQLKHFKFSIGDLWILAGGLSFAIYTALVRLKPKEVSALSFLFVLFLLGTLFLVPPFIIENIMYNPFDFEPKMLWIFLYLGVGTSVLAFLSWNIAIKKIGTSDTALFGNLIPVFSTIEAYLILNETINSTKAISLAVILCGIIIANSSTLFQQKNALALGSKRKGES